MDTNQEPSWINRAPEAKIQFQITFFQAKRANLEIVIHDSLLVFVIRLEVP